ncbi:MAG: DUF2950 family protein [Planctomycetota bacterium]|nr:DUF2950 family protein [Planctomycetota bacterium]
MPVPSPPARWQFGIPDLIFFALVSLLGQSLTAAYLARLLGYHPSEMPVALITLALTLAGGLAGFVRAQKQRHPEAQMRLYVLLYALGAWLLPPLAWWAGQRASLTVGFCSLPGLLWAFVRIRRKGYDDLRRECCVLASLAANWGVLAVLFCMIVLPNMRCRVWGNESAAIAACKTYAEAQDLYRRTDWDSDGVLEYAQHVTGDHSLFEKNAGQGDLTLVCAAFAAAADPAQMKPKSGYCFKILTGQGTFAAGGRRSYLTVGADGAFNMTKGYALLAWPAKYGDRGQNTFIINNTGTVYQKDLGPNTANIAAGIVEYDPWPGWVVAE